MPRKLARFTEAPQPAQITESPATLTAEGKKKIFPARTEPIAEASVGEPKKASLERVRAQIKAKQEATRAPNKIDEAHAADEKVKAEQLQKIQALEEKEKAVAVAKANQKERDSVFNAVGKLGIGQQQFLELLDEYPLTPKSEGILGRASSFFKGIAESLSGKPKTAGKELVLNQLIERYQKASFTSTEQDLVSSNIALGQEFNRLSKKDKAAANALVQKTAEARTAKYGSALGNEDAASAGIVATEVDSLPNTYDLNRRVSGRKSVGASEHNPALKKALNDYDIAEAKRAGVTLENTYDPSFDAAAEKAAIDSAKDKAQAKAIESSKAEYRLDDKANFLKQFSASDAAEFYGLMTGSAKPQASEKTIALAVSTFKALGEELLRLKYLQQQKGENLSAKDASRLRTLESRLNAVGDAATRKFEQQRYDASFVGQLEDSRKQLELDRKLYTGEVQPTDQVVGARGVLRHQGYRDRTKSASGRSQPTPTSKSIKLKPVPANDNGTPNTNTSQAA